MGLFVLNEIQQLFPGATTRTYTRGQVIMYGGDQSNHVMYIKSGAYKFYDIDRQVTKRFYLSMALEVSFLFFILSKTNPTLMSFTQVYLDWLLL